MIFNHLKYLKPTWYFNLRPDQDQMYFPTEKQMVEAGWAIKRDTQYTSEHAQVRDKSWTAFQSGYISQESEYGLDVWTPTQFPIEDEYRFLRKNFHKAWVTYVLILRLVTFNNPFNELIGFFKTRTVKRVDYAKEIFNPVSYEVFESELVQSQPFISVVIPTLNRYEYLKDVFKDLEKQTYKNFEVIVVDQTDAFQPDFYKGWKLDLKFWFQQEKALWKARNEAIKSAKGDYILLYDDDSLVDPDWIYEHLKCLDFYNADLSSGVSMSTVGAEVPKHYSYFRWSDQLDTGNVLLKKEIFSHIGLFDRKFEKQRMGDGEFGLRAYLAGYKNISNPKAKRIHLKVSEGGLRQMGSWDELRPKKFFAPRPIPSVLYLFRKYYGNKNAFSEGLRMAFYSFIPYRHKGNNKRRVMYIFMTFLLIFPVVGFTFYKSWRRSGAMLRGESKIELLKN